MSSAQKAKFTGWHMTTILVAFFGVVFAVNFAMARMAVGSFGGTVVDNSYVASQNYNRWLAEGDRQEKLGWTVKVALNQDRMVLVRVERSGQLLDGVAATGDALHPLGRADDIALQFRKAADGQLISTTALPSGRWNAHISVRQGPDIYRLVEQLQ